MSEGYMDNASLSIGPLKKVFLTITAADSEVSPDIGRTTGSVEFVFGIGANGLTRFECMIADKHVGDQVVIPVRKNEGPVLFGRLFRDLPPFSHEADPVFLHISISAVSEPTQREIIKAMAEAAACGADCECGCGSH